MHIYFSLPAALRGLAMSTTLNAMLSYLDALDGKPSLEELLDELGRFDIGCDDLASFIRFGERSYQRNLVRAGEWYHAWVLCWRNGQRSPIHDHHGSNCVVRVLRGILTETIFEFAPNGHVKACFSRDLGPGSVLASSDTDLHQVSNLQAGSADLVTMHVYSPPLLTMGTYSLYDRSRGQEVWELDFTEAAGI
jgi:cysteine dioxygenase